MAGGRAIGALAVSRRDRAAPYEPDEARLAQRLADQSAPQLESRACTSASTRSPRPSSTACCRTRCRRSPASRWPPPYLPAGDAVEAGGDWYEAMPLDGGPVALAVGDVVGKGARAAAAMGQLRSALRALATEGIGPAELLARLSRFAETVPEAGCATIAYVVLEPAGGEVRFACAGHPYPLLVRAGGAAELLRGGRGAPLGGLAAARYAEGRVRLGEGDALVLYSDGLVEGRDHGLDTGFARLGAAAGHLSRAPVETVCDGLLAALGAGVATDDIALLVARRMAPAR